MHWKQSRVEVNKAKYWVNTLKLYTIWFGDWNLGHVDVSTAIIIIMIHYDHIISS